MPPIHGNEYFLQWIPLKKTTLGQPKVVFITDWSLYPKLFTA